MKPIWKTLLLVLLAVTFSGCPEENNEDPDPNGQETFDPLSMQMDIGPYGGELELTDEYGNTVRLTILPGALTDTVGFTLTLLGEIKELPIETRELRTFTVEPVDLNLYIPGQITIEYADAKQDIEEAGIFRVEDDQRVAPCLDHEYSAEDQSVRACFLKGGEFAEGEISLDQAKGQMDLFIASLGVDWKSSTAANAGETGYAEDCSQFKETWEEGEGDIGALLQLMEILFRKGYYDEPGGRTLEDDIKDLCDKIVSSAARNILEMPKPSDPCCRDYKYTIASLLQSMMLLGCEGSTYDQVDDRFKENLQECKTYVIISSSLNVSAGGFTVETSGVVQVTIKDTEGGNASVTGSGSLEVSGKASAGGQCSSTISGTTHVQVSGTRDAAYFFNLDLVTAQIATMVTICPDNYRVETPLTGGGTRNVVLSPHNGYSITIEEPVDEGSFTMEVSLMNPYTDLPGM